MIHILTLTWNGLDKLKRLAPSLIKNVIALGMPVKWYIRSNGCVDGTKEWLKSWDNQFLDMEPLFYDHNRDNFAQGVNSLHLCAHHTALHADRDSGIIVKSRSVGILSSALIAQDYTLLLNNDIEFADQTSLYNMMKLMKDPKVGVVGARLLYNDTNRLQHGGVIFGPKYGNMPYHYRHQEESDKHAEKNRHFQAVTAACCIIKGKAYCPMDEKFSWAFEDVDLCLRIGMSGWKIAYCGETKIYHEESATLKKNPVNKMFLPQNVKRFKEKWFGKYDLDHEKYLRNSKYKVIK